MAKWGIIGCGVIADTRFAPALNSIDDSSLVAVQSRSAAKAQEFAKKHGAMHAYDSAEELCQDPAVEAVYIASPNHLHAEHTILVASYGKHAFCEKPMALNVTECKQMIEAARENDVLLGIAYMMPFHGSHRLMKTLIEQGLIGEISLVKSDYLISLPFFQGSDFSVNQFRLQKKLGGGPIMDLGVHCINTIRYLIGSEAQELSSMSDALRFGSDAEDTAVLLVRYESGILGAISLSFATEWGRNGLEFYGDKGALISEQSLSQTPEARVRSYVKGKWTEYEVPPLNPYVGEIEHFTECIQTGQQPIISGEMGLADMRVVEAARKSSAAQSHIEI